MGSSSLCQTSPPVAAISTASLSGAGPNSQTTLPGPVTAMVVADSSKVGRRAFARICAASEVDVLVTDAGITAADAARFAEVGTR